MIPLNQLHIPAPCHEDWGRMTGDQRRRFCDGCGCHVHDLSALTRDQAQALLDRAEGRLCVRYTVRDDGVPQTLDAPASPIHSWWLPVRRLAVAVSGLLALAALGPAARAAAPPQSGTSTKHTAHATAHAQPRPRRLMGKIAGLHRVPPTPPHVLMGAPPPPPRSLPTMGIVASFHPHTTVPPKP